MIFYASYINGKEIICIPSLSEYDSFLLMWVLMTVRYSLGYYIKLGWIFAVFGKNRFLKLGTEAIIGLSGLARYQWESRIIFSHFENT